MTQRLRSVPLRARLRRFKRQRSFLRDTMGTLYTNVVRSITILRWRCGLTEGPPHPFRNVKLEYSTDGESWLNAPDFRKFELHVSYSVNRQLGPQIGKEVVELIKTQTEEPLGRQLFREAWALKNANPRSALIIGVAAAEVGFKRLVGYLVPHSEWLMDEIQTPSLEKMLHSFLPTLPVNAQFKGKVLRPPRILLKQLTEAVKCRNKAVHVGQAPPNKTELVQMLRAISDFLWICDLYSGQAWVGEHISVETLKSWEDEVTAGGKGKAKKAIGSINGLLAY